MSARRSSTVPDAISASTESNSAAIFDRSWPRGGRVASSDTARSSVSTCARCSASSSASRYSPSDSAVSGFIAEPEIKAEPEQPFPGDTVTFSWDPIEINGRLDKCSAECADGGEQTECGVEAFANVEWVIERKVDGEWVVVKQSGGGNTPTVGGAVCDEVRITVTASKGAFEGCGPIAPVDFEKSVTFADFRIETETVLDAPDGSDDSRKTIGLKESVILRAKDEQGNLVNVLWTIRGQLAGISSVNTVTGGEEQETIEIFAEGSNCNQSTSIKVIEPQSISYAHAGDIADADPLAAFGGVCLEMTVKPLSVRFSAISITETASTVSATGGLAQADGTGHCPDADGDGFCDLSAGVDSMNVVTQPDQAGSGPAYPVVGTDPPAWLAGSSTVSMTNAWRISGPWQTFGSQVTQISTLSTSGTIDTSKGGVSNSVAANAPPSSCN